MCHTEFSAAISTWLYVTKGRHHNGHTGGTKENIKIDAKEIRRSYVDWIYLTGTRMQVSTLFRKYFSKASFQQLFTSWSQKPFLPHSNDRSIVSSKPSSPQSSFQCFLFQFTVPSRCLKIISSSLRLLPRLAVTSSIFRSFTNVFKRQFLRKVWPVQLAFLHFTVCRIFISYLPFVTLQSSYDHSN